MIYRALECTVYGREHYAPMTVWFQADRDADAAAKVRRLLALAWDAAEDDVCMGNVDSELAMERHALVELEPRKARWFVTGCWGDIPYFDAAPQIVLLDGSRRPRLDAARESAGAIARVLAERLQAREDVPAGAGIEEINCHITELAAFAAMR